MPRKEEDLEKVTIRLFRGDAEKLSQIYPNVGYNEAIRKIVRNHIRTIEERKSMLRSQVDLEKL